MSSGYRNILLISYVFPPYYGVGGRRWAKHAVELARIGYTVHVVCAKNPFKQNSIWYNEIKNAANIHLYQLPAFYPVALLEHEQDVLKKIAYKFWDAVLPFFTRGSVYDRSVFWKTVMLKKTEDLIKKFSIQQVICSGAPFSAMYYATLLKKKFPDLFLLNDLRDPWTWGPNWGYSSLGTKRMDHEKQMEKNTIEHSDIISVPSEDMKTYLIENYPKFKTKFVRIPHFFDPAECSPLNKTKSNKIRFVMYGNIYQDMESYLNLLSKLFTKFEENAVLDVYTDKLQHAASFKTKNVTFLDQLPPKELFSKFNEYDFVLLLNPPYNKNNISTKFYEIIYSRTPIFIFSETGIGPKFVTDNDLGIHADFKDIEDKFEKVINGKDGFKYNLTFNVDEYSLHQVTLGIVNILDQRPKSFLKPEEIIHK